MRKNHENATRPDDRNRMNGAMVANSGSPALPSQYPAGNGSNEMRKISGVATGSSLVTDLIDCVGVGAGALNDI